MVGSSVRTWASRRTPSSASRPASRAPKRSVETPPEVGDRTAEPAERARGVERAAARVRDQRPVVRRHEIDQRLTRDDDDHAATVLFRSVSVDPRAGQLPEEGDLIDVDALLAAYFERPPAAPVAFGTSGHRGTSLDGSFTEAHVVAISAAVCRYRDEQGTSGPLYLGARHARALGAGLPHDRRGARRRTASTSSSTPTGATPTPVISHAILTHNQGGSRAHNPPADGIVVTPVAQPARRRRLQVQPAARRAGRHRRHRLDRARGERAARGRAGRRPARARRRADRPRPRLRLRRRPRLGDRPRRDPGLRPAARRRPARRREPRLLAGDPRPPRARPGDRQRGARPDVPLRPARLGREDPDGLLVAVRDGAAARHGRPLRRRLRQRPGRRPARDRHAVRRPAQPEPPPRGLHLVPVRRRARLGPGRRDRQDARLLLDHRPRRRGPRAPARRGAGRLQVVRPRAARRDDRVRRRGERGRVVPAPRRHGLEHRQGRADPVPARGGDDREDRQGPGTALRRARRPLRRRGLPAHRRRRHAGAEGRAQAALARPGRERRAGGRADHRGADRGARQRRADRRAEGRRRARLVRGAAVGYGGRVQGLRREPRRRAAARADRGGGGGRSWARHWRADWRAC